jgi:glycosyltransferase involved in cell wall biosynthesis
LRILWLNWRDIRNPEAGGAEVLTHEIARRLIEKYNYHITLFTSNFQRGSPGENIDGISIIRDGGKFTVYAKAKNHYMTHKDDYDIVIDEINARGFLTPKFIKEKPILALIHQISPEVIMYEMPFPLNFIGRYYLEKKWLSYYKDVPTVTVSQSSKKELEAQGFRNVFLVPEGISISPPDTMPEKESDPTVVFIGRLKKHKLPHHAIQAFCIIKKQFPNAKMWVIGQGYLRSKLERLNVRDTTFYGYVSDAQKYELLSRAHLTLTPAIREGWGLVVVESNAMGTPVIAYDVPGLRDSVQDGQTGILVKQKSPSSLAFSAISLLEDPVLLKRFSMNAIAFSKQFNWEKTTYLFKEILEKISKYGNPR